MSRHSYRFLVTFVALLTLTSGNLCPVGVLYAAPEQATYTIRDGEIVEPLTSEAGNAERGKAIALDRERGDCVVCHALPLPDRQMHGTVGPALDDVGRRYAVGALRLRIVDSKVLNPESVMPAYHNVRGLSDVRTDVRSKLILTAQEIEDVVAYLATLTSPVSDSLRYSGPLPAPVESSATMETAGYKVEGRRSGYTYLSADTQQLQNDEFANPGMLWVERGAELWKKTEGNAQRECGQCHGAPEESMRGVRARYPRFDRRRGKLINLEQQINRCRQEQMRAAPYAYESDELLALTTFVSYQSRGLPVAPRIDVHTRRFLRAGEKFFRQRRGQLDLACTHCHEIMAGKRLRGDMISQGQSNGFPIYRQLWQTLGSAHRMFVWCNTAIRAEPLALGADMYVNLELYMAWRARGLPVESPAIRR